MRLCAAQPVMSDNWTYWLRALAGEKPQSLVRGVPEQGFWLLRERKSKRTPEAERTVGGPRHKISTRFHPVAIWEDEIGWHCVVNYPRAISYLTDPDEIDEQIFARCSCAPITHETYLTKCKELENERDHADQPEAQSAGIERDERDHPAQYG